MNIEQANTVSISVILDKMNRDPQRERSKEVWYYSPFRKEKTASFKINLKTNAWYDFGIGKGGDVVDLVCRYLESQKEDSTPKDALRWIRNMAGFAPVIKPVAVEDNKEEDSKSLVLKDVMPVKSIGLIRYGESRGIPHFVIRKTFQEIHVLNKNTNKTIYALGMKNESGFYELRNSFFKGCVGKKDISFFRGTNTKEKGIHIFEGAMDYVSAIAQSEGIALDDDAIVLNSLSCLKQATAYIKGFGYRVAYTWMDNDKAGTNATKAMDEFFKTEEGLVHKPMNEVYSPHKDVNAWHMHKLSLSE